MQLQMFSSKLQFISSTVKLFYLEQFAICIIQHWKVTIVVYYHLLTFVIYCMCGSLYSLCFIRRIMVMITFEGATEPEATPTEETDGI